MKFLCLLLLSITFLPASLSLCQLSPWEAVPLMQKGINLGNTLEPPLEGGWNNPPAQQYYFDLYKQAGFNTIRIPVRWDEHTLKTSPYTIASSWLDRVEELVNWALTRDLFVVINAHHDDWIKNNYANPEARARFDSIWSQIAFHFKDKPEKLLFEILNEPYGLSKAQNDDMHARVLSVIRKINPTRIVIIQGHNWGGSDELLTAAIPDDDYLMGSFHSYDPYLFGLEGQGTWGTTGDHLTLENKFKAVKNWSDTHNMPVFLGEFGSLRSCDYNSRMKHYRAYVELSQKYGFISCAWDDGGDFRIMERTARKWDEVKDILISTNASAPRITLKLFQDTINNVSWNNALTADSIYVEYRPPTGSYKRIVSLPGDSLQWLHSDVAEETYHHYRIVARYSNGELKYSEPQRLYMPKYVPLTRGFFLGNPHSIPGIIEAEDFDTGGEGLSWHEATITNLGGVYRNSEAVDIYPGTDDGFYVGSVWPGEWFEHTVIVENESEYIVHFHVAAKEAGGTFIMEIGGYQSDTVIVPSTQSSMITTIVSDTLHLDGGQQIMRITILNKPFFSIDKIEFIQIPVISALTENTPGKFTVIRYDDLLIMDFPDHMNVHHVNLVNGDGRNLRMVNNPAGRTVMNVGDLPRGMYVICAVTNHGTLTRKIIINR